MEAALVLSPWMRKHTSDLILVDLYLVVLLLTRCSQVLLILSCRVVLFLLCVCVCDLFLFLQVEAAIVFLAWIRKHTSGIF